MTGCAAGWLRRWSTGRRADNPDPAQHQMKESLGADAGRGLAFSMDRISMNIHGNADSHIDALCHVIFDGQLYNGVAADTVTAAGAAELSIGLAADGIVGPGVLLDVAPRLEVVVGQRPGRGDPAGMLELAEVAGAQPVQGGTCARRIGHHRMIHRSFHPVQGDGACLGPR